MEALYTTLTLAYPGASVTFECPARGPVQGGGETPPAEEALGSTEAIWRCWCRRCSTKGCSPWDALSTGHLHQLACTSCDSVTATLPSTQVRMRLAQLSRLTINHRLSICDFPTVRPLNFVIFSSLYVK